MLRNDANSARRHRLLLCACGSALAMGAGDAAAQDAARARPAVSEVEQVVVTARRKEENLQSVPVSVQVVSGEQLARQSVNSVADLQRVTPGLTLGPTSLGSSRPAFQIRGQRSSATRITADPAVVLYFAEVGTSRAAGTTQSLFDLESVQVLKGPQGTLFGRNTTGGAVLITPKAPTNDFEGHLRVSLGNFQSRIYEAVVNIPVSDQLQIRLGAQQQRRDGYFRNVLKDERTFDEDNSSYRVSVRVKPNDNITSDFIATYFYSEIGGLQTRLTYFNAATFPIPPLIPIIQAEVAQSQALGFYQYQESIPAHAKDDVKSIQNNSVIELGSGSFLGDARIKNIIAYRRLKNGFTANTDGTVFGLFDTRGYFRGSQFSEELQLQGLAGKLDYLLGAFYSDEKGEDFTNTQTARALPRSYTDLYGRNKSMSVFAHGNVPLSGIDDGLTLSAGIRLTNDKRYINTHNRQIRNPTPALPAPFVCTATGTNIPIANVTDRSLCSVVRTAEFTEPTWDISLNWQVDPDHLLYIAHRHGYRSGAASTVLTPDLRPEKVNDIEIGSKNDLRIGDAPLRLNVVGFYGKYKDLQRNQAVLLNGAASSQDRNAAAAHVYGVETELNVRFNEIFSLKAGYTLTKAKYDDFSNTYNTPTGIVVVDNTSAIFSYAPEHMVSLDLRADLPISPDKGEATISLGYSYQSNFQTQDGNTMNCGPNGVEKACLNAPGLTPGFGLFSGRAEWRRPFGAKFDVAVFGTNLADKKYLAGKYVLISAFGIGSVFPGPPRMVGVELRVPFGAEAQ